MKPVRHPAHDQLTPTVHNWFHLPYQAMGYLAEQQRWGTYWNNSMVYPQAESFLSNIHLSGSYGVTHKHKIHVILGGE